MKSLKSTQCVEYGEDPFREEHNNMRYFPFPSTANNNDGSKGQGYVYVCVGGCWEYAFVVIKSNLGLEHAKN